MSYFLVRVDGVPAAVKKTNAQILTAKAMLKFIDTGSLIVLTNVKAMVNKDSWDTHDSFFAEKSTTAWPYNFSVITEEESAIYLEHGTEPGYFPNVDSITPWAERHNIDPWAFAISVKEKGTKPHPFMEKAVSMSKPALLKLVKTMAYEIEANVDY